MTTASSIRPAVASMPTVLAPNDQHQTRSLQRERLDAAILRSLGERRAHRMLRTSASCEAWDDLEQDVARAVALLWKVPVTSATLADDLLAFCAFVARELEVTASMNLDASEEWARLEQLAPRAVGALDAVTELLRAHAESNAATRALASVFGAIRAHFVAASVVDFRRAA